MSEPGQPEHHARPGPACCGPPRGSAAPAADGHRDAAGADRAARADRPGPAGEAGADAPIAELAEAADGQLRMVGLAGGTFRMGSTGPEAYPADGEGPVRRQDVAAFALAARTVTVAEFAVFVQATGHRTDAEGYGDSLVFAGLLDSPLRKSSPAVPQTPWWRQVSGACWHRPEGPGSSAAQRGDHPVTHVSRRDAEAYAAWSGTRLPTEAEWEYAARGGLDQQPYPWGAEREPQGRVLMNTFPGRFPDASDGPVGTVPAGAYPPNAFGLHNMTGNVWEWTSGRFGAEDARAVLRGGSYMCHASYCRRYRTSARIPATPETSLGHTGFRVALSTG